VSWPAWILTRWVTVGLAMVLSALIVVEVAA
jgi:hypothetical protein